MMSSAKRSRCPCSTRLDDVENNAFPEGAFSESTQQARTTSGVGRPSTSPLLYIPCRVSVNVSTSRTNEEGEAEHVRTEERRTIPNRKAEPQRPKGRRLGYIAGTGG
jgi:hypothetical protein